MQLLKSGPVVRHKAFQDAFITGTTSKTSKKFATKRKENKSGTKAKIFKRKWSHNCGLPGYHSKNCTKATVKGAKLSKTEPEKEKVSLEWDRLYLTILSLPINLF